jgi:osmoprotectant transport system ATP-binding protein
VLSEHAHLEQYVPPAELLAAPANDFVREFVGGDRGIKRLAVTPIPLDRLRSPDAVPAELPTAKLPAVEASGTLQDALAAMLREGSTRVMVRDNGTALGVLTAEDVVAALAGQPAPAT